MSLLNSVYTLCDGAGYNPTLRSLGVYRAGQTIKSMKSLGADKLFSTGFDYIQYALAIESYRA